MITVLTVCPRAVGHMQPADEKRWNISWKPQKMTAGKMNKLVGGLDYRINKTNSCLNILKNYPEWTFTYLHSRDMPDKMGFCLSLVSFIQPVLMVKGTLSKFDPRWIRNKCCKAKTANTLIQSHGTDLRNIGCPPTDMEVSLIILSRSVHVYNTMILLKE